jgi:hypothetical protein
MARNMCEGGIHEQLDAILDAITEGARKALDEIAPEVIEAIDSHMDIVRDEGQTEGYETASEEFEEGKWLENLTVGPDNTQSLAIVDHAYKSARGLPCVQCGAGLELRGSTILCTKCRTVHTLGI